MRRAKLAGVDNTPAESVELQFKALLAVIRELRRRCPWDREQTLQSAAKNLIEEAYEAVDAVERADVAELGDELGDLVVQVLFLAEIAAQDGRFGLADLLDAAKDKLIRRHPHVYGDAEAKSAAEVVDNWRRLKREEQRAAGLESAVDGVARALPALMRAEKLGERARGAGMDWPDARAVLAKVREELDEVERALGAGESAAAAEELGDMMLALANVPRFIGRSAEETLSRACDKFIARFKEVEALAAEHGLTLSALSLEEGEALWREAKERAGRPG